MSVMRLSTLPLCVQIWRSKEFPNRSIITRHRREKPLRSIWSAALDGSRLIGGSKVIEIASQRPRYSDHHLDHQGRVRRRDIWSVAD